MAVRPVDPESADRSARVLDAAADLLVRWGYRRVTIEDVARAAGIGKGTVYLHFRTKDALFLTVMLRIHRRLIADLAGSVERDPTLVLPWCAMRRTYDLIAADDIARPIYLGDPEVLGRLAQESATTLGELQRRGRDLQRELLGGLREAGVVRTDLSLAEQMYCFAAIGTGFFVTVPDLVPAGPDVGSLPDVARRGALLEHATAAVLRAPGADDPERLASLAPDVGRLYRGVLEHLDAEWERRVR